jgi:hypothetical protein
VAEFVADDLFRLGERFRRDVLQREAAQRKRDAGFGPVTMHIGKLQRAAAEIADNAVRLVES